MSARELASFPLPPQHRTALQRAGFRTVDDLADMGAVDLSKELAIPREEALELLETIRGQSTAEKRSFEDVSALDLLRKERTQPGILTFCDAMDQMLGGGVPAGKITELCGPPGTGKTQFGMQLAVDVQIPSCFGGLEGEAVYIDTEGSFVPERAQEIAHAAVRYLRDSATDPNNEEQVAMAATFDADEILSRIHVFRVHTYQEQIALCYMLEQFCVDHPRVRLVVIDSVAFHFRQDFANMALRTRLLHGMAQTLTQLARQHNLAVVLMNQMTTKIGTESRRTQLVPALGESWGHACTIRVVFSWQQSQRCATLFKSPSAREQTINYDITSAGVRDIWAGAADKRARTEAGPG
eukprot:m.78774 g.78774  ORF g.78774 m.78774 type:complete len:353 (+) comp7981_c0_seq4:114-1172(+)